MKNFVPLLLVFGLFSCKNTVKRDPLILSKDSSANTVVPATKQGDSVEKFKILRPQQNRTVKSPIYGDNKDSVNISTDTGGRIMYTKGMLRKILKYFPELYESEFQSSPDITYEKRGTDAKEVQKDGSDISFGCELCKDDYYELYAYFLNLKFKGDKYKQERFQLIKLYRHINEVMGRLALGGTYYGHQYSRILGYAEYSTYLYSLDKYGDYQKKYPILKQKKLYINSLRQFITDELGANMDITERDKLALKKKLFETVDEIDRLITNYFYLQMVQEFQHSNY